MIGTKFSLTLGTRHPHFSSLQARCTLMSPSGDAEDMTSCWVDAMTTAAPCEQVTAVVGSAGRTAASCTAPGHPTRRAAYQELPVHHNPLCTAEHACNQADPLSDYVLFWADGYRCRLEFQVFYWICSAALPAQITHTASQVTFLLLPSSSGLPQMQDFLTGVQETIHPRDGKPMKFSYNLDSLKKLPGGRKVIFNCSKTMLKAKTKDDFYFEVSSNPLWGELHKKRNISTREDDENMHLKPLIYFPTSQFSHLMHSKPCIQCKWQRSFHCYYCLSRGFQARNYLLICKQLLFTCCLLYSGHSRASLPASTTLTISDRSPSTKQQVWQGHNGAPSSSHSNARQFLRLLGLGSPPHHSTQHWLS